MFPRRLTRSPMSSKTHLNIGLKAPVTLKAGEARCSFPQPTTRAKDVGACKASELATYIVKKVPPRRTNGLAHASTNATQQKARAMAPCASAPSGATRSVPRRQMACRAIRPLNFVLGHLPNRAHCLAVWRNEALHNIGACVKIWHADCAVHHYF